MSEFVSPGWKSGPVLLADTFWKRWRGLRMPRFRTGLWLRGCSVHTFGMTRPLWICGLDPGLKVLKVALLGPSRIVWMRGAASILELGHWREPPAPGMALTWIDGRNTDPLFEPDRQSR